MKWCLHCRDVLSAVTVLYLLILYISEDNCQKGCLANACLLRIAAMNPVNYAFKNKFWEITGDCVKFTVQVLL